MSIAGVTVSEGDSGTKIAEFDVTLSRANALPVSVAYATGGGSATAGTDYVAANVT